MITQFLYALKWFVLLMLLQVFVFNHIHIAGYATPLPYVFLLLILPSDTSRSVLLLWGFVMGFIIDTFTNTPGMAAASMTVVALLRPGLLTLFGPNDKDENSYKPSVAIMRRSAFTGYVFTAVIIHEILYFSLEAFSFFNWQELLINIGTSSVLTTLIIAAIESIRNSDKTTPKE